MFKQPTSHSSSTKPREPQIPDLLQLHDFQFFNVRRLSELYEKAVRYLMLPNQEIQGKDVADVDEHQDVTVYPNVRGALTLAEQEEKEQLLKEGFITWGGKDFNAFIKACEKYGRNDIEGIASDMEDKTLEEVKRYAKVFKERYKELNDYDKIIEGIERGEAKIARKNEIMEMLKKKVEHYENPWLELKIQYDGQSKGSQYNEENDRFMICMMHKVGYGNWEELKAAFRYSELFRFDVFIKSRTPQELGRRCDTLIQLIEKENQVYED